MSDIRLTFTVTRISSDILGPAEVTLVSGHGLTIPGGTLELNVGHGRAEQLHVGQSVVVTVEGL